PLRRQRRGDLGMAGPAADRRDRAGPGPHRSWPGGRPRGSQGHLQPLLRVGNADMTSQAAQQVETLPSFSEQVAGQLGGVRGMIESSIPVLAFVLVNIVWDLKPALVVAVGLALAIAAYRLTRRQSVRHAVNGLAGIGIGALLAWKTGSP